MAGKHKSWLPKVREIPADEGIRHILKEVVKFVWPFLAAGALGVFAWLSSKASELSSLGWISYILGFTVAIFLIWGLYEWTTLNRKRKVATDQGAPKGGGMFAEALGYQTPAPHKPSIKLTKEYYSARDRDRIADILSEMSNIITIDGNKINSVTTQIIRAAEHSDEDGMRNGLNEFIETIQHLMSSIFHDHDGLFAKAHAYKADFDLFVSQNAANKVISVLNDCVHQMTTVYYIIMKVTKNATVLERHEYVSFRNALRIFIVNSHIALDEFGKWRSGFEEKRSAFLALLAEKVNNSTNLPA